MRNADRAVVVRDVRSEPDVLDPVGAVVGPAANGAPLPEVAAADDDDIDDLEELRDQRLAQGGRRCGCPWSSRASCHDCDGTGVVPISRCPACAAVLPRGAWGICDACRESLTT